MVILALVILNIFWCSSLFCSFIFSFIFFLSEERRGIRYSAYTRRSRKQYKQTKKKNAEGKKKTIKNGVEKEKENCRKLYGCVSEYVQASKEMQVLLARSLPAFTYPIRTGHLQKWSKRRKRKSLCIGKRVAGPNDNSSSHFTKKKKKFRKQNACIFYQLKEKEKVMEQ